MSVSAMMEDSISRCPLFGHYRIQSGLRAEFVASLGTTQVGQDDATHLDGPTFQRRLGLYTFVSRGRGSGHDRSQPKIRLGTAIEKPKACA